MRWLPCFYLHAGRFIFCRASSLYWHMANFISVTGQCRVFSHLYSGIAHLYSGRPELNLSLAYSCIAYLYYAVIALLPSLSVLCESQKKLLLPLYLSTEIPRSIRSHSCSLPFLCRTEHLILVYLHRKNQGDRPKRSRDIPFLGAPTHLYKRLCALVGWLVGWLVSRSVG